MTRYPSAKAGLLYCDVALPDPLERLPSIPKDDSLLVQSFKSASFRLTLDFGSCLLTLVKFAQNSWARDLRSRIRVGFCEFVLLSWRDASIRNCCFFRPRPSLTR